MAAEGESDDEGTDEDEEESGGGAIRSTSSSSSSSSGGAAAAAAPASNQQMLVPRQKHRCKGINVNLDCLITYGGAARAYIANVLFAPFQPVSSDGPEGSALVGTNTPYQYTPLSTHPVNTPNQQIL